MTRKKIRIKKIDNVTARQVTFSKRRRGIFKKSEELSVLCDADVALIIFSATGKLFEFSSSRMRDILARYNLHTSNLNKLNPPPLDLQLENSNLVVLSREVEEKNKQLCHLRGEDLQGLNLEDLHRLEKLLESGLGRVLEKKGERSMDQISSFERRGAELEKENNKLRERLNMLERGKAKAFGEGEMVGIEEGTTTNLSISGSSLPLRDDCSDTSLKLALPFSM
ncbi:PREDICTED: MADS-box protein AGL24-like [Tarenaya hassleriana]|uniref:MADS-box protein AGL24-like n=1 Tax=Tarenaya hassleriana TaxID=28532 RepID=UPI00053C5AA0|nr:PREDICTED: MADS-box protein AGL24-like [Tarenaya hassleriana]XP_010530256.1 PREDICTED: MADS-box protein AGL24-like [Tarenaya hassleriana]